MSNGETNSQHNNSNLNKNENHSSQMEKSYLKAATESDKPFEEQKKLFKWIKDNVDLRVPRFY